MESVLYIEISVIGIFLLILVLINQKQSMGTSTLQKRFNNIIYVTMAALVVDAACWWIDGKTFAFAQAANLTIETCYYLFEVVMPFLWVSYVEIALSEDVRMAHTRSRWLALPMAAFLVMMGINLKNGMIFYIDAQNQYHRGSLFILSAILPYCYLMYASVRALVKAAHAGWSGERKRCLLLAAFILPPVIGSVVQTFMFGVAYVWICTALGILMVYIDMQNRQISTDPLTGLNNRRELSKFLIRETRDADRISGLALIMMDVDHFKAVNDTYGHYYGDVVLMSVAGILKKSCRGTSAFLARYGGDEFCIVYPTENAEEVESRIAAIQSNIDARNREEPDEVPVSLSIGYSLWDAENDRSIEMLYRRADMNMYQAKRAKVN